MDRERIQTAIANLQKHAVTKDERALINYLKINLGNLWELEDDHPAVAAAAEPDQRQALELLPKNLDNNKGGGGLEIRVPGFKGNPECPDEAQIFIEYYEGKLRVHVWNGEADPNTVELEQELCKDCVARLLLIDKDVDELETNPDLTDKEVEEYQVEIAEVERQIDECGCH